MKVICPVCEKVVAAYIPKGGDGTAYRPYKHVDRDGRDCDGRFDLVDALYTPEINFTYTQEFDEFSDADPGL